MVSYDTLFVVIVNVITVSLKQVKFSFMLYFMRLKMGKTNINLTVVFKSCGMHSTKHLTPILYLW